MTTSVIVETHDWPVEAVHVNPATGDPQIGTERVEPNSKAMFYLSDSTALTLRELPKDDPVLTI